MHVSSSPPSPLFYPEYCITYASFNRFKCYINGLKAKNKTSGTNTQTRKQYISPLCLLKCLGFCFLISTCHVPGPRGACSVKSNVEWLNRGKRKARNHFSHEVKTPLLPWQDFRMFLLQRTQRLRSFRRNRLLIVFPDFRGKIDDKLKVSFRPLTGRISCQYPTPLTITESARYDLQIVSF